MNNEGQRHVHMPAHVRQDAQARLRRIEGQVGGLRRMLDEDRYCVDVLTQVASVREALRQVGKVVLHNYLQNCVAKGIQAGDETVVGELISVIDRFNRQG